MILHHAFCKFCERPVDVKSHPDCAPEDVARLLPLLACNHCADARRARNKAWWSIHHWIGELQRVNDEYETATNSRREKLAEYKRLIRMRLAGPSLQFLEAIARQHNRTWTLGSDDLVEQLMEMPKNWRQLLTFADEKFADFCL